jgi:hypothetical protein
LVIWVDDPKGSGRVIVVAFQGVLGKGLQEGDSGLRTDVYHWVEKECDTWLPGHPRTVEAKNDLYQTLLAPCLEDLAAWEAAGSPGDRNDYVRRYIPPPAELLVRFEAWERQHSPDIKTGKALFTEETLQMHKRSKEYDIPKVVAER